MSHVNEQAFIAPTTLKEFQKHVKRYETCRIEQDALLRRSSSSSLLRLNSVRSNFDDSFEYNKANVSKRRLLGNTSLHDIFASKAVFELFFRFMEVKNIGKKLRFWLDSEDFRKCIA